MKILSVKNVDNSCAFEIELDQKEWAKEYASAKKNLVKNVQIPGFRKGHVPANMIEERINPADVMLRTLNNPKYAQKIISEILESKEFKDSDCIDSLGKAPEIVKAEVGKAPVIKYYFDLIPEVKGFKLADVEKIELPEFKGQDVPAQIVKNEIKRLIKNDCMISEKKEQVVAKGNIAVINFKGFVDGEAFAGGEAKNYELEIGSKSFIDDFEDQLIGCKKGDKKDVNVKFPKDYPSKNLAGKDAKFEVEVLGVKEIEYPEINKEYLAKFHIEAKNEKELEKYIENLYAREAEQQYQDMGMRIINDEVSKKASLNYYPDSLINMHKQTILNQYQQEATNAGFKDLKDYKKRLGLDDAKFEDVLNESAKKCLVVAMVYEKLIEELKLKVDADDKKDYIEKLTKYLKGNEEQAKKFYDARKDECESFILKEKLFKKLIANTKKIQPKAELKEDKKAK